MDEPISSCDCPDPIDYSDKLDALIGKMDKLLEHQAVLQETGLYVLSALAVLVGCAVVFGFWIGWRARG